jgi:transposase-like protein
MSPSVVGAGPPYCPNSGCGFHRVTAGWRFKKIGHFRPRHCAPRAVQRYRCLQCRRSFSDQTFRASYWLRRGDLLAPLFYRVLACSGYRQIARELGVAPTTVERQIARLGRHCLLYQQARRPAELREPLVLDGFESFEFSQYHPLHLHLAVGRESHFFYGFTDSELRRKGRMTARQRRRRAALERSFGRPDPGSITREVRALLRLVVPRGAALVLHSDDHPAYPRALRGRAVEHRVTPGRARRTPRNPLFPVNLLDLLIRHSSANHKRETIAFSKRRQSAAERLAILQVWRNFMKSFSERRRDATPAQRLGICDQRLTLAGLLRERLLPSRIVLPERLERYYRGAIPTRRIPRGRTHRLRYAD